MDTYMNMAVLDSNYNTSLAQQIKYCVPSVYNYVKTPWANFSQELCYVNNHSAATFIVEGIDTFRYITVNSLLDWERPVHSSQKSDDPDFQFTHKVNKRTKRIPTHTCGICFEKFFSRKEFSAHVKTHRVRQLFTCSLCGKTLHSRNGLAHHYKIHTGSKPYECHICNNDLDTFRHNENTFGRTCVINNFPSLEIWLDISEIFTSDVNC